MKRWLTVLFYSYSTIADCRVEPCQLLAVEILSCPQIWETVIAPDQYVT